MKFEIGDLVRGITDHYGVTDTKMKKGVIVDVDESRVEVRVIKHDDKLYGTYWVSAEDFEKIGHAEMFDRDKFNVLLKENKRYAVEYLVDSNLRHANLTCVNLTGSINLIGADLSYADLRCSRLKGVDMDGADLSSANLSDADLTDASLRCANLSNANLLGAKLFRTDLRRANLSGAKGLLNAINFMETHFERTDDGYICYKTFNATYSVPDRWKIKPGEIIEENVNFDRCCVCGYGINVAPIEWVRSNQLGTIYKMLIRFEWLPEVVVPFNTDGKIRCGRAQIIEAVE